MKVMVNCPLCSAQLTCDICPGEAATRTYPGSEAALDDIEGCACFESTLVYFDRYWEAVEEKALNELRFGEVACR